MAFSYLTGFISRQGLVGLLTLLKTLVPVSKEKLLENNKS